MSKPIGGLKCSSAGLELVMLEYRSTWNDSKWQRLHSVNKLPVTITQWLKTSLTSYSLVLNMQSKEVYYKVDSSALEWYNSIYLFFFLEKICIQTSIKWFSNIWWNTYTAPREYQPTFEWCSCSLVVTWQSLEVQQSPDRCMLCWGLVVELNKWEHLNKHCRISKWA